MCRSGCTGVAHEHADPLASTEKPITGLLRGAVSILCLGLVLLSAVYTSMQATPLLPAGAGACWNWQHGCLPPLTLTRAGCLCRLPRHRGGSHSRSLLPGQRGRLDSGAGQRWAGMTVDPYGSSCAPQLSCPAALSCKRVEKRCLQLICSFSFLADVDCRPGAA